MRNSLVVSQCCVGWHRSIFLLLDGVEICIVCPLPSVGRRQQLYCLSELTHIGVSAVVANAEELENSLQFQVIDGFNLSVSVHNLWTDIWFI